MTTCNRTDSSGYASDRQHRPDLQSGFSLPEVLVALSIVVLGAAALISNNFSARARAIDNVRFLSASRLAAELSDWGRQGGLKRWSDQAINPLERFDVNGDAPVCFSDPCDAEQAAHFYLRQWRQRLDREVPRARVVVCGQPVAAASTDWSCGDNGTDQTMQVIKIGWPSQADPLIRSPRLVFALT